MGKADEPEAKNGRGGRESSHLSSVEAQSAITKTGKKTLLAAMALSMVLTMASV